jgi:hypothetical protein
VSRKPESFLWKDQKLLLVMPIYTDFMILFGYVFVLYVKQTYFIYYSNIRNYYMFITCLTHHFP